MKYIVQTSQEFFVTYAVEADSPEEAWELLVNDGPSAGDCIDQSPEGIIGDFNTADITEAPL